MTRQANPPGGFRPRAAFSCLAMTSALAVRMTSLLPTRYADNGSAIAATSGSSGFAALTSETTASYMPNPSPSSSWSGSRWFSISSAESIRQLAGLCRTGSHPHGGGYSVAGQLFSAYAREILSSGGGPDAVRQ
jgi:hypothetical protein